MDVADELILRAGVERPRLAGLERAEHSLAQCVHPFRQAAVLATFGPMRFHPHRVEMYISVMTGLLVIGIGLWLLQTQLRAVRARSAHADHIHEQNHAPRGAQSSLEGERLPPTRLGSGARSRHCL